MPELIVSIVNSIAIELDLLEAAHACVCNCVSKSRDLISFDGCANQACLLTHAAFRVAVFIYST